MDRSHLSESAFYILLSLAPGPKHGYAIIQDVLDISNRRLHLSTGTLFGVIKRMLADGWIEPVDSENAPRGRKPYRLSATGRLMLMTEYRRLRLLVELAKERLQDG